MIATATRRIGDCAKMRSVFPTVEQWPAVANRALLKLCYERIVRPRPDLFLSDGGLQAMLEEAR